MDILSLSRIYYAAMAHAINAAAAIHERLLIDSSKRSERPDG